MEASGGGKEQAPSGFVRLHAKPAAASESVVGASALSLAVVSGEDVRMTVPAVRFHIGTFEAGTGTLYVTTE